MKAGRLDSYGAAKAMQPSGGFPLHEGARQISCSCQDAQNSYAPWWGYTPIQNTEECSKYCSHVIHDPIDYRGRIEEFKEELDIKIDRSDNEITAEIAHRETGDDIFLSTNAFILRDDQKSYYYKTHQIIRVTDAKESYLLGTSGDLDLTLKHVTEEE